MKWFLLVTLCAVGYAYVSTSYAAETEYETVTMSWEVPKGTLRKYWYSYLPGAIRESCTHLAMAQRPTPQYYPEIGDDIDTWEKCEKFLDFPVFKMYWKRKEN